MVFKDIYLLIYQLIHIISMSYFRLCLTEIIMRN